MVNTHPNVFLSNIFVISADINLLNELKVMRAKEPIDEQKVMEVVDKVVSLLNVSQ
jgi:hypothetical protein